MRHYRNGIYSNSVGYNLYPTGSILMSICCIRLTLEPRVSICDLNSTMIIYNGVLPPYFRTKRLLIVTGYLLYPPREFYAHITAM